MIKPKPNYIFTKMMLFGCCFLIALNFLLSRFFAESSLSGLVSNVLVLLCVGQVIYAILMLLDSPLTDIQDIWICVTLVICGFLPLVFKGVLGGNPLTWLLSNVTLAAFYICAKYISSQVIWHVMGLLNIASLLTVALGPLAFSEDTRSVLFATRLTGVLGHPNVTAFMAVCAIVFGLHLGKRISTYLVVAAIVTLATFSLTSFLALISGLVVLKILRTSRQRGIALKLSLAIMALPMIGVIGLGWSLNPELFTNRTSIWSWLKSYGAPPPFGYGLGFLNQRQAAGEVLWVHAHNQLMMTYFTQGIVGLLVVVTLLLLLLKNSKFEPLSSSLFVMLCIGCTTEIPLFLDYPSGRWLGCVVILILIKKYRDHNPVLDDTTLNVAKIKAKSPEKDQLET